MNKIHQIKRALILAAGRGTRLAPLTDDRPKPMVEVCGRPIITTILDALKAAEISSITIVRGYRGAAFDKLTDQYEGISFLDNPDWETSNNISSVTLAGAQGLLEDTYVVEGDLYLANPAVITPTQERSNYIAFPVEETDDWRFAVDAQGRITEIGVGWRDCLQMLGLSYWRTARVSPAARRRSTGRSATAGSTGTRSRSNTARRTFTSTSARARARTYGRSTPSRNSGLWKGT